VIPRQPNKLNEVFAYVGAFELSNYERANCDCNSVQLAHRPDGNSTRITHTSLGFFQMKATYLIEYIGKQLMAEDFLPSCNIKVPYEVENPGNIILMEHRT
jgi:hypothetical protein